MGEYHNILLATDLSEQSHRVAHRAGHLAKAFSAQLHIIHVIEPIPAYAMGYVDIDDIQKTRVKEAKVLIEQLCTKCKIKPTSQLIEQGITTTHILATAQKLKNDLIVVGSHGASGLARLLGSTASSVIHKADCDVLTVRYTA